MYLGERSVKPPPSNMGQKTSTSASKTFQPSIFFKQHPFRQSLSEKTKSIFSRLTMAAMRSPKDLTHLISDCISAASSRTKEHLGFRDPEGKFHPSPQLLTQVFLMTYIKQSVKVGLTDSVSCTAMTPEQRVLLGADWVWGILEKPTKNPKIQVAVQVLHLAAGEGPRERAATAPAASESLQMAQMEWRNKNTHERLVNFCASIGKDCYALFLFFGKTDDKDNIYGVLSNNFEKAVKKCDRIDRGLIENFFRGSKSFHTPLGMIQAIFNQKMSEPLTLVVKFS